MKKTIIAGAASLALAAMPMAGVFAASKTISVSDTLKVTVPTSCSFSRSGTAGAGEQSNVVSGPTWSSDTYAVTLNPGGEATLGTSSFTAYCNVAGGFKVTVDLPDLEATEDENNETVIEYSDSGASAGTEGWTLTLGSGGNFTEGENFMESEGPVYSTTPKTETATYKVATAASTPAGTYTGVVTYTFTYDDPVATN